MGNCVKSQQLATNQLNCLNLIDATIDNTSEPRYLFTHAKIIKVYDGDTITIAAEYAGRIYKFAMRIYGINCDEIRGGNEKTRKSANLAKDYVTDQILNKIVNVKIMTGIELNGKIIKDKYGRLIGSIQTPDGLDLATELIRKKLAIPYWGGTKTYVD